MKRFLNYRGFLFLALGFVGGVLCAYALWRGKGYWLAIAFGTAGTGALVGVILKNKKILLTFILIITALFAVFPNQCRNKRNKPARSLQKRYPARHSYRQLFHS